MEPKLAHLIYYPRHKRYLEVRTHRPLAPEEVERLGEACEGLAATEPIEGVTSIHFIIEGVADVHLPPRESC